MIFHIEISFSQLLTSMLCAQGLKSMNKAARDLLQKLQKIDGDNYPEVYCFIYSTIGMVDVVNRILQKTVVCSNSATQHCYTQLYPLFDNILY
jgi:hypothetical protein